MKDKKGMDKSKIEIALEYGNSIIATLREPFLVLDKNLRVISANQSFYNTFKVAKEDTLGRPLTDLGNRQWDIPRLLVLLREILPEKKVIENYEIEHEFEQIGQRCINLNVSQLRIPKKIAAIIAAGVREKTREEAGEEDEEEELILLAIEDITERKEIEAGLEKTRKELAVIKKSADEVSEFAESVINTVREPLISLDKDLRVVMVSRSFYDFFKVKPEETVGQLIYDLGNKQWNIPKLRELLETILPQKTTFDNYEVEHNFAAIGRRIMLLNARQIERGMGKERVILLAIEDITERKEIEAGLEKTRKELEVTKISEDAAREYAEIIINTVREPLIVLDQDLRVVTASRSFYEVFKVNTEETVGQLIYDLGNKQWNIPKLRELLENILPQEATLDNYEVEHDFSTIGMRTMLLNARQIQRVLGKERIILLAIEDITERKAIENGLEKIRKELEVTKISEDAAREYAESIINTVREPLIALDQDLRVVTASRSFCEVFKVSTKETVGQLIYDLGNKQWNIPRLRELLETILPQKTTFDNYEVEHDFSTIGMRTMLLNARQIEQGTGKERIILLAIEDITERKKAEEATKEVAEAKSKFASMVSHELRSPLTVIKESINLVMEGLAGDVTLEQKDILDTAKSNIDRLGRLINNVLDFQKMEAGKTEFDIKEYNINEVVLATSKGMNFLAEEKGMSFIVNIDESLPRAKFDKDKIIQVLTNLLSNAVKFTEKGSISITTKSGDSVLHVMVEDTGLGIQATDMPKLFQTFEQLGGGLGKKTGGTGLGLAISKEIIQAHNGNIWAESQPGKGSIFHFTLPIKESRG
ncbi:MAG: PAS domain-containing sensor histidine kinase [Candidatus Omnitrophica bacterium]|nr:PAS domain-containing sensor histidine kinase [Candidatus Omnitrophota bacterium]